MIATCLLVSALLAAPGPAQGQTEAPIATYNGSFTPIPDLPFFTNELKIDVFPKEVRVTMRVELGSTSGGQRQCYSFAGEFAVPATVDPASGEGSFAGEVTLQSGVADVPCEVGLAFIEQPLPAPVEGTIGLREITGRVGSPDTVFTFDYTAALEGTTPTGPTGPALPDLLSVPDTPLTTDEIDRLFGASKCGSPPSEECDDVLDGLEGPFGDLGVSSLDKQALIHLGRLLGLTSLEQPNTPRDGPLLLPTLSHLMPVITKLAVTASTSDSDEDADQARRAMYRLTRIAITMDLGKAP